MRNFFKLIPVLLIANNIFANVYSAKNLELKINNTQNIQDIMLTNGDIVEVSSTTKAIILPFEDIHDIYFKNGDIINSIDLINGSYNNPSVQFVSGTEGGGG